MSTTNTIPNVPAAPGLPVGYDSNTGTIAPNATGATPPVSFRAANTADNILMVSPDGQSAYVPQGNVSGYLAKGAKLGVRMTAPNGEKAIVPFDRQDYYQQNGAKWDADQDNINTKKYMAAQPSGFSLKALVARPSTAAGTSGPQPIAQADQDMIHGNFVKAGKEFLQNEIDPLRVIQGSPLERAIRMVDPSFRGGVAPQVAADQEPLSKPLVDVSQFINVGTHPISKAVAEVGQSLTTPSSIAMTIGAGVGDLVQTPQALAKLNQVLAAGFSATAAIDAYKNIAGVKAAFDNGDMQQVKYLMTHALLSGTLAAVAGTEAARPGTIGGVAERVNPFRERLNAARAVASTINPVDSAVESTLGPAVAKAGAPAGAPATEAPTGDQIQPNLQAGIRSTVNQAATAHGFNEIPASTPIRDVPKALGDQAYTRSKATFDAAQAATGIDFTALKQNIFKLNDQISDLAITDPEKAGALLQQKLAYEAQADAGMKSAAEKGVNVMQARSDWNLQLRADELSKHLRNSAEGPLSNPTINPSKFAPRLQKFNEAEVGEDNPKLSQLLGKDVADQLVTHAENAREQADVIKAFESVPSTDAVALNEMARSQATTNPSGKVAIDWGNVLQQFDEMPNEEQVARFTRPNAVRALLTSLAQKQARWAVAKKIAIGLGATAGASAVGREVWDTLR